MKVAFKVVKSTKNAKGTFVWKLEVNTTIKAFGVEKQVKRTFYIGNMPVAGVIDSVIEEDLNRFEIREYAFAHPETGEQLMLKWLHAKPF